ncbi:hypothetical protein [uncultured Jatrophihabitans sp.]|uniref:hypothetical protein n=1 Tax=uncultured Jatrophihabitans sp. TaxID=1610747 RepID=UPI0035CB855E
MRRSLTITFAVLVLGIAVLGLVVQMFAPTTDHQTRVAQVLYLLSPVVAAMLGGYLTVVRPQHAVGWFVMVVASAGAVDSVARGAIVLDVGSRDGLRSWAAWLDNWTWVFLFGGVAFLILYFPTGRLPSARWRGVAVAMTVVVVGEAVACALVHKTVNYPKLHTIAPAGLMTEYAAGLGFAGLLIAITIALASLWLRRRVLRREGDLVGLAQIRWLLWAAANVVLVLLVGTGVDRLTKPTDLLEQVWDVLSQLVFFGIPFAIGIAISRHGLFEIDRVVSRTVSYLVVTGVLLGMYVGIIAAFSSFLPNNPLVVAGATLTVAALFVPVRRSVQTRVDRRFNRSKYNRALLVERFAEQLRGDVTHGSDGDNLLTVVGTALQPTHAGLWLAQS